jgi:hypothetical protein
MYQYLIENPEYTNDIYCFIDEKRKLLKQFDKNCIFDILKFVTDLNSKLKLDINFDSDFYITNKYDNYNKEHTILLIQINMNEVKVAIKDSVNYDCSFCKPSYILKEQYELLAAPLIITYLNCHRLLQLYEI